MKEQIKWAIHENNVNSKAKRTYRDFDEVIDTCKKRARIKCQHCGLEYPHPRASTSSSTSTANLNRHRNACRFKHRAPSVNSAASTNGPDIRTFFVQLNQSQFEELLMRAMVACNWPFTQFATPAFIELLRRGFPRLNPPTPRVMHLRLERYADEARDEIKNRFRENDSRISLALDCWTSPNRLEFMGMSSPHNVVA
jgi:hypothetical protein